MECLFHFQFNENFPETNSLQLQTFDSILFVQLLTQFKNFAQVIGQFSIWHTALQIALYNYKWVRYCIL